MDGLRWRGGLPVSDRTTLCLLSQIRVSRGRVLVRSSQGVYFPRSLSAVLKGVSFEHRALNVLKEHLSMSLQIPRLNITQTIDALADLHLERYTTGAFNC